MPRPKTRPEDIRDPEHYFNRYVAMEVKHELTSNSAYYKHNVSWDDMFVGNGNPTSNKKLRMLAANTQMSFLTNIFLTIVSWVGSRQLKIPPFSLPFEACPWTIRFCSHIASNTVLHKHKQQNFCIFHRPRSAIRNAASKK